MELSARKKFEIGRCEECGSTSQLEAHHLEYPRDWYKTTLEMLRVLCSDCHGDEHGFVRHTCMWRENPLQEQFFWRVHDWKQSAWAGKTIPESACRYMRVICRMYPDDQSLTFHACYTLLLREMTQSKVVPTRTAIDERMISFKKAL